MLAHRTRVQAHLVGTWQERLADTPVIIIIIIFIIIIIIIMCKSKAEESSLSHCASCRQKCLVMSAHNGPSHLTCCDL